MQDEDPAKEPVDTGPKGRISLGAWEELSGRLQRIHADEDTLTVVLSTGSLVFDVESLEARRLIQRLQSEEGADVSILRTDDPRVPLRVRVER